MNHEYLANLPNPGNVQIAIVKYNENDAELDEMWSFVQNKSNQRWLWLAICHETRDVLAFVFGKRKDKVFLQLRNLLEPFGIRHFYTDDWGTYLRKLPSEHHVIGKTNTQRIERKNLTKIYQVTTAADAPAFRHGGGGFPQSNQWKPPPLGVGRTSTSECGRKWERTERV